MFANIQTAGMIDADALDTGRHAQSAHVVAEVTAAFAGATTAPVRRWALIGAAENMYAIKR